MNEPLPTVYLVRHGETAWSLTGQHTGLTDLPLTERGRANAARLQARLLGLTLGRASTPSPIPMGARWVGLEPDSGRFFLLSTASVSALGYDRTEPVIRLWNDIHHLEN